MSNFPKIKGLKWLYDDYPDLVAIDVVYINRKMSDLGIKGLEIPEQPERMYVDLSQLSAISPWFPDGQDEPSETECSVDISGVNNFIANVNREKLLEAWIFCKRFKYSRP